MSKAAHVMELSEVRIGAVNLRNLRHVDWLIILLVLVLAAIGLFTLHSASHSGATESRDDFKQAIWFCVGLAAALVIICMDHRFTVSLAPVMYFGALGLLMLVLLFGEEAHGSTSWFPMGPFRFQPSEITKVGLVYALAWYFAKVGARVQKLSFFALPFAIMAVPFLFILKQNDLGTALTLCPIVFVMLYVAGCRVWHLVLVILLGLATVCVAWPHLNQYHRERVLCFVDPAREQPEGKDYSYHQIQSKITVGSGRMQGKGFGKGTQTHLNYLPQYRTDFIFSLLAEERGFVGSALVIGLFMALFLRAVALARDCPERSGSLVIVGCVTILCVHAFANIAITIGLMPVIGLPLPFLSYGGSFYLTTMICIGGILNAPIRRGYFTK